MSDEIVVQRRKNKPAGEETLRSASVVSRNIHLIDLAIAVRVVYDKREFYAPLEAPCLWYADMLFSILERHFKITGKLKHLRKCEESSMNREEWEACSKVGRKWRWSHIDRPSEKKIDEIAALYAEALAQFEEEACFFSLFLGFWHNYCT
jgi:hypothetical protein